MLALTACGFRLAGTAQLPESLSSIYLVTTDMTEPQRARLVKRLEQAGSQISDSAVGDASILAVRLKAPADRTLVTSASTGKRVRRLSRELDYRLTTSEGEVLIEANTLSQQQDLTINEDSLHASNQERDEAIEDLEQALYNQLIYRLQRF